MAACRPSSGGMRRGPGHSVPMGEPPWGHPCCSGRAHAGSGSHLSQVPEPGAGATNTVSLAAAGGWETQYMCCSAAIGSAGCQVAKVRLLSLARCLLILGSPLPCPG